MPIRSADHLRRAATVLAVGLVAVTAQAEEPAAPELVVCADPSNLPYSNEHGDGFENRIARLLAEDLHATLRYEWNAQHRGFLRRGINGRGCDLLLDVPAGLEGVRTLRPSWTSSYAFVTRRDDGPRPTGFDDPRLAHLRIGLQAIGAEGVNTPPAMSLAARGLAGRVVGFGMTDASDRSAAAVVAAVDAGTVDVAILWGPFAGWFAREHGDRLEVTPVIADARAPELPYTYAMSAAVRSDDAAFGERVQAALERHAVEIRTLIASYGVPMIAPPRVAAVP